MAGWRLTKTRLTAGVWEGVLEGGPGHPPEIEARYLDRVLPGLRVEEAGGIWAVRLQIPPDVIADGVQTIVIAEKADGRALDSVALIAGDALADDIRAEMDLLRAELDMLKRAFRRHCVETA